jgi:hypothetical protein
MRDPFIRSWLKMTAILVAGFAVLAVVKYIAHT